MAILSVWAHLLTLASTISAYVIHGTPRPRDNSSRSNPMQQVDRREVNPNPADFGWINRWAAIGDSFTAGIGSGHLYSDEDEVSRCSRYSHSYPALINDVLGPAVDNFQFVACSGDRSQQIYDQVQHLNGNLNFVIMTAGGNDLCLVSMHRALGSTLEKNQY